MNGFIAVYLREMMLLKRRLKRQLAGMAVSPLLYLVTFGYAVGKMIDINGHSYIEYLIPGLIAMSSMTQSFAIATDINVARFYWYIFEEFQSSPVSNTAYVSGEILAGMTRSMLSVSMIILLSLPFCVVLRYGPLFWVAILLDSFLFSALAVALAMLVKSHADQSLLSSFIITPMAFLGGTFFPLDRLPQWAQTLLWGLPLSHASKAIRATAFGETPPVSAYIVMVAAGAVFFLLAVRCVDQARD